MKHHARKRFGQHFLTDQSVLQRLMAEMGPRKSDLMVEIGPGLGALTAHLIGFLDHLHVIEIDRDLAQRLRSGPWQNKLTVHEGDVLKFDWSTLPSPLRVVGNLPYNISSPILFTLLEQIDRVKDQYFMLQKEVVDRMAAPAGHADYGRLGVMLQAFYDIESLFDIPPEAFDPPPKVMSSIVVMVPKPAEVRNRINLKVYSQIVAAAFSQRRKMLRNNWAGLVSPEVAGQAGIELTQRAEQISVEQYLKVAELLD